MLAVATGQPKPGYGITGRAAREAQDGVGEENQDPEDGHTA